MDNEDGELQSMGIGWIGKRSYKRDVRKRERKRPEVERVGDSGKSGVEEWEGG